MNIFELTELSLEQFIPQFENEKTPEKFTTQEEGMNILQWAILSTNLDVVKYLLAAYPYDLSKETNAIILTQEDECGFKLINLMPLSFDIFKEVRTNKDSYKNTLHFLTEEGIIPEKVSMSLLDEFMGDVNNIRGFFTSPYFQHLIECNLLDSDVQLSYININIMNNDKDIDAYDVDKTRYSGGSYLKNTCDKIIKNANLNIDVKKVEDLIHIIENLEKLTGLTHQEVEYFKSNIIKSFKHNNGINTEEELFLAITEGKINYCARWVNRITKDVFDSKIYNKESSFVEKVLSLLQEFGFDTNNQIPLSDKVKELSLKIKDVSLFNLTMPLLNDKEKESLAEEMVENLVINKSESSKEDDVNNKNIKEYVEQRWGHIDGENIRPNVVQQVKKIFYLFGHTNNIAKLKDLKYSMLDYYFGLLEQQKMIGVLIDESKKNYNLTRAQITEKEFFKEESVDKLKLFNLYSEEMKKNFSLELTTDIFDSEIGSINRKTYRSNISRRPDEGDYFLRTLFNLKMEFDEINQELRQIKGLEFTSVESLISDFLEKNKERDFSFLAEEASSSEKLEFLKARGILLKPECDNLKVIHNLFCNRDKSYEKALLERNVKIGGDDLYTFLKDAYIFAHAYTMPMGGNVIGMLMEDKIQNTILDLFYEKSNKNIYSNDISAILSHFNKVSYLQFINKDESYIYDNKAVVKGVLKRLNPFDFKLIQLEKNIIGFELNDKIEKNDAKDIVRKRM